MVTWKVRCDTKIMVPRGARSRPAADCANVASLKSSRAMCPSPGRGAARRAACGRHSADFARSLRRLASAGVWATLLLAVSTAGCAGGRSAVQYRGTSAAPRVTPPEVADAPTVPLGHVLLGRVRAECTLTEGRREIEDEWLSDVDCTEWRLTEALRDEAARQGGDVLVGSTCLAARRSGREVVIRCEARVARSGEDAAPLEAAPSGATALRHDDPSGVEAWRIRVTFHPAVEPVARAPRRADAVNEVTVLPLVARPLGSLSVSCEEAPCSVEAVRAGVRVAAGRLGATHVAGIRCVDVEDKPHCLGEAAFLDELLPSEAAVPR